jgi:hypothetical protein
VTPELRGVWENIRDLGLGAMQHALRLSFYSDPQNPSWSALSVLSAAHAAELLIKARIAQEHPLLIFETMPKARDGGLLDFGLIASEGRTFQYSDLPGRLWAATGKRIANENEYKNFGRLRNIVQHFAEPGEDLSLRASAFVFNVVDPFIGEHWGLFAIDYNEENGDHFEHIFETLVARDLRPRLSPTAIESWRNETVPQDAPAGYRRWFERAIAGTAEQPAKRKTKARTPANANGAR